MLLVELQAVSARRAVNVSKRAPSIMTETLATVRVLVVQVFDI